MMGARDLMRRALRLARRGEGYVEPNPMVGCVLARGGETIGEGWHRRFGEAHAAINALADCRRRGRRPAGCEAYVTLEPCCHDGKTPPCTRALIDAGVARVHAAMRDPFPAVAGRGIRALRRAGVQVEIGLCEQEARELTAPYVKRVATGLPWVIVKWAQTLDGKIATTGGDSKWISNERSRRVVHQLRGRVDAVITGIGTVTADDPRLTARGVRRRRVARRVVVDPHLRLPLNGALMRTLETAENGAPLTVATSRACAGAGTGKRREFERGGVEVMALPLARGCASRLDLRPLLEQLARRYGATNVLVEAGTGLISSFFEQSLVDQVIAFIAPKLMGSARAPAALCGAEIERIRDCRALALRSARRIGDDVMLDYRVPGKAP